jgi:hypothetical protein
VIEQEKIEKIEKKKKKPCNLPYLLGNISNGSQGGYLKIDLYA